MAYKYQPIKDEIFVSDNEEETEDDEDEEENNIDIADEFEVPTACPRSLVKIYKIQYVLLSLQVNDPADSHENPDPDFC